MSLRLNPKIPKPLHDFRNFLSIIWEGLGLPEPTPVQYDIAYCMQHGIDPDIEDKMIIEAFRGIGKSYVAVAFVLWCLIHDPDHKIMVVSASKIRADDFSSFAHRIIQEIDICKHMRAKPEQSWSHVKFDVADSRPSGSPSVKSVGITGQLTGSRADLIVSDDCETPGNSMTQMQREKLRELVKEFDAIKKPGGRILYLGTPQTEASLYNILQRSGFPARIWPSEYPSLDEVSTKYGNRLAPMILQRVIDDPTIVGHSTDPKRFTDSDLLSRKLSYGRSGYGLQFLLDTTLSDADRHPLRISDLIVMSCDLRHAPADVIYGIFKELKDIPNVAMPGDKWYAPEMISEKRSPYQGCILAIDPSGRGKDETGYAVVAALNGILYLLKAGGRSGTGYSDENLQYFAQLAKTYKVTKVIVESNFGDGMFNKLFEPILMKEHPCFIEEVRHNSQKEARIIDTLEPVINQHRLVIDPRVISDDYESVSHLPAEKAVEFMLLYQFTRITRDRGSLAHDDRLDALAIGVKAWLDVLNLDATEVERQSHEEELEAFRKHIAESVKGSIKPYSSGGTGMTGSLQSMSETDIQIINAQLPQFRNDNARRGVAEPRRR